MTFKERTYLLFVVSLLYVCAGFSPTITYSEIKAPLQDAVKSPQEIIKVERVIDGTSLVLENGKRLTLSFLAVPTLLGDMVIRGNERRINRANARLSELVLGQGVTIQPTSKGTNRYGLIPVHLFLKANTDDQKDVGEILLEEGLVALRHTENPTPMWEQYLVIEESSRKAGQGIWKNRALAPACEAEAKYKASRYAIIAGDIEAVSVQREVIYINFTNDWREDFTVRIAGRGRKALYKNLKDILEPGSWVEVRGWVSWINGPMIDLTSLTQIKALDGAPGFCEGLSP